MAEGQVYMVYPLNNNTSYKMAVFKSKEQALVSAFLMYVNGYKGEINTTDFANDVNDLFTDGKIDGEIGISVMKYENPIDIMEELNKDQN